MFFFHIYPCKYFMEVFIKLKYLYYNDLTSTTFLKVIMTYVLVKACETK